MKKAFTLVELIVVIGIIGILAGVLLVSFGGATESAKLAKCQSNLRNLGMAVNTAAMESGVYPYAESAQYLSTSITEDGEVLVGVHRGWLSWLDEGMSWGGVTTPQSVNQPSYCGTDDEIAHALTNGVIWRATGKNHSIYQCPVHAKACQSKKGRNPGWSYVMNPFFGYEREKGQALSTEGEVVRTDGLSRADRRLLFAEIQGLEVANLSKYGAGSIPKVSIGGSGSATDGVLQYQSEKNGLVGGKNSTAESIGFNHFRGSHIVGLVAFADGHTEAIILPQSGNLEQLTGWLCDGYDVTYVGGDSYERVNDSNFE